MKLTVIGATGMVGSRLVTEATGRGHAVIAAARNPGKTPPSGATSLTADATEPADVDEVLDGAEAAILAVRAAPGSEHVIAPATRTVLGAAARAGVRVLVIGGAGPLRSPSDPATLVIDDPRYVPKAWRQVAGASVSQWGACAEHPNGHWVYLSPPAVLEPGARTGVYRRGRTTLLTAADATSWISAEDLAVAALDEIERPGTDRHFTVAEKGPAPERNAVSTRARIGHRPHTP